MRASHQGFLGEIAAARTALERGDRDAAFARLERAHILGQLRFFDHVVAHIWMLRVARLRHDRREVWGQVLRLAATVPGHLFGWVPIGNTGGADVSPLKPMPIPADLTRYFEGFSLRRKIVRQWTLIALAVVAVGVWMAR
ncbi:MAG: hypothetical protein DI570_21110 [Phenylobacterium zucineum]|nr:MAG: hypothetical protein DI570_21110 [Phenylobacterium zucineum]